MEGVKLFNVSELPEGREAAVAAVEEDLKTSLEGMARALFGDVEMRCVCCQHAFLSICLLLFAVRFRGRALL